MKNMITGIALLFLSLGFIACGPSGNQPNVELMQDMMVQPAIKAQRYDEAFKNGISQQLPPEHTVPVGFTPYKYGFNADLADKELKNPYEGKMTAEVLTVGQKYYEIHCMLCHGMKGQGDGPIAAKFPLKIPALVSDKIKGWKDARIYHTITMGQGVMGSYASHVPQAYRWQLVNYIRYIQKNP